MNEGHLEFLSSPAWAELLERDLLPWVFTKGDLGDEVLEIGPGPGLTTDLLRSRVRSLTAVELDTALAERLTARLEDTNVTVIQGDAADTALPGDRFSAVTCFSMLHHIPMSDHQDRVFAEVHRVLRKGGMFIGVDAIDTDLIRQGHVDDVFNPVDPATLGSRLEQVGMTDVHIDQDDYQVRFVAKK